MYPPTPWWPRACVTDFAPCPEPAILLPKKGTGQFSKAVVLLSRHILEILIYYRAKLSKGAQNKRIPVQPSHRHESTTKAPPPTVQRTSPPRHGLLQLNSTVCLRNLENPHSLSVNSGFVLRPLSVFLAPGESLFFFDSLLAYIRYS